MRFAAESAGTADVKRTIDGMTLLSAQDEQVLTQHLSAIEKSVTLLLFTQAIGGSESGPVAKQVLNEVARLNDKITVVEKNFVLDVDDRAKYGIDKSPAIVILSDGQDTRMRMFGAPTGYEFVGLVEAILTAGTGEIDLEEDTLKLLASVDKPTNIQVFSTPT
jgi:alkyl hydroperoxide reductase subunit AhpF